MYTINRAISVVKSNKPFLDWLHSIENDGNSKITMEDLLRECSTFLLPDYDFESEYKQAIKDIYEDIFEIELEGWYTDESLWPKDRSYKVFCEWFDIEIHSCVYDPWEGEIEKEIL